MNLLKTKTGRLAAFGGLYMSEGLPQGFAGVALALEFKRRGMDAAALGTFAATIMLPWTWKFIMGPFVDNLHIRRFGARKQWIVFAQVGMLACLAFALMRMPEFTAAGAVGLGLFTTLMVLHNVFAATQDVAIDALACSVLKKEERGLANGLMFGCAQAGNAIGGSGVLFIKDLTGSFGTASLLVPFLLLAILACTITMICEKSAAREMAEGEMPAPEPGDTGMRAAVDQIRDYAITVGKTIFGTRRGFLGFALAILPFGGMALSMTVSTVIAPSLGMDDSELAKLNLVGTLFWVPACLSGGWFSDRFGRRLSVATFSILSVLPGLWMGYQLRRLGWDHPPEGVDGVWPRQDQLIGYWWIATIIFSVFNGLMYGVRAAFFMDIVNPKIAGTHFTALMAMLNLVTAYTYFWQGQALDTGAWNWTLWQIFLVDTLLGLVFLAIIPFVQPKQIHLDEA
ncbi:MFS transporter [Haloferula helveola]|uniref:MFS transporter n=1 Tax=Haloferula helveola TaxID=490095 RepID=A0ABM7RDJ3_9BACT|nr:MFS transporter [Haloferula helveola]